MSAYGSRVKIYWFCALVATSTLTFSTFSWKYIRHPTYFAMVIMWLITPLMFGVLWGLIPGILAIVMVIFRTIYEDRMLQEELPGYKAYAQKVRFRLLPGVW
jgi:protein-S-isoprenylcysteine O-methyltransferase Ste14